MKLKLLERENDFVWKKGHSAARSTLDTTPSSGRSFGLRSGLGGLVTSDVGTDGFDGNVGACVGGLVDGAGSGVLVSLGDCTVTVKGVASGVGAGVGRLVMSKAMSVGSLSVEISGVVMRSAGRS